MGVLGGGCFGGGGVGFRGGLGVFWGRGYLGGVGGGSWALFVVFWGVYLNRTDP